MHHPDNEGRFDELRRRAIEEATRPPMNRSAFEVHDIVRIGNGHELIITALNPTRPANCWSGVKPRGEGKVYVFGPKHRPVKIGHAPDDHPALVAMRGRQDAMGHTSPQPSGEYKAMVLKLVDAVLAGDLPKAQAYAELVQELTPA